MLSKKSETYVPELLRFCPNFEQIKTLRVRFHPLYLQLLHHWLW